jgi:NADH:ubiquinone oxidoreductase subunit 3 (subunit A)
MDTHPALRGLARLLPGVVAALLAFVYLTGSVNAAGSFSQAGLSIRAVRQLSLEQILVRGVSVVTQPELLLAVVLLGVGLIAANRVIDRIMRVPIDGDRRERSAAHVRRRRFSAGFLLWNLLFVLVVLILTPWTFAVFVAGMAAFFAAAMALARSGRWSQTQIKSTVALCGVVGFLGANYVAAFPQPSAVVLTSGKTLIRGVFVTHTDSVWYVGVEKTGVIRAFPDSEVRHVAFRYGIKLRPSVNSLIF